MIIYISNTILNALSYFQTESDIVICPHSSYYSLVELAWQHLIQSDGCVEGDIVHTHSHGHKETMSDPMDLVNQSYIWQCIVDAGVLSRNDLPGKHHHCCRVDFVT